MQICNRPIVLAGTVRISEAKGGQLEQADIGGQFELATGLMPAGAIEQDHPCRQAKQVAARTLPWQNLQIQQFTQ